MLVRGGIRPLGVNHCHTVHSLPRRDRVVCIMTVFWHTMTYSMFRSRSHRVNFYRKRTHTLLLNEIYPCWEKRYRKCLSMRYIWGSNKLSSERNGCRLINKDGHVGIIEKYCINNWFIINTGNVIQNKCQFLFISFLF